MFKLYFSIGLWFLSFLCFLKAAPSISYTTQEQIKNVGETVELNCFVDTESNYTIGWFKNSSDSPRSLSTGSKVKTSEPRFAIHSFANASSSTYILEIKNIQETDAGTYQCKVHSPNDNKILADVKLSVHRPALSITISRERIKYVGETAELDCSVNIESNCTIIWVKRSSIDGSQFLSAGSRVTTSSPRFVSYLYVNASSSTSTLQIKDLQETDTGAYRCLVYLPENKEIVADVELSVRPLPVITDR